MTPREPISFVMCSNIPYEIEQALIKAMKLTFPFAHESVQILLENRGERDYIKTQTNRRNYLAMGKNIMHI